MPLAPGLLVRTLVRPGGRLTTVVVRRRRVPAPQTAFAERRLVVTRAEGKPERKPPVPAELDRSAAGFSRPLARALAVLGARAWPVGVEGVVLDGRRVPLARLVAEANRALAACGQPPIPYPRVRSEEGRR